ncbi:DJ-1/PfpI family protein [Sphaerisporangium sp. NPDC005288]|uniref:DJ-1/PfpI family protein n=1 Tax=Sphaerisporangium rhizosphaerae TaxID=2269375 RepID=A0ABW2P5S3_9ACTN
MRIVIPLFQGFTALDVVGPYEVLRMLPEAQVVFTAPEAGPVRDGVGVLALSATATPAEVDSCDVLVVPGGPGARTMMRDEAFTAWIRRLHDGTTWTTSVCTGSLILGGAGLLEGLRATTHWGAVETLEAFGATYTPERVVVQGKIVTAAGVSSGIDMALTLFERIAGRTAAEAAQLAIEYDPQPPFDAGSPAKAPHEAMELLLARRR